MARVDKRVKFIVKAEKKHNIYTNSDTEISIMCPIHKEFNQTLKAHLHSLCCLKCADII
jgi:hypothetical protein